MIRTLLAGAVVAVFAGLLAFGGEALGVTALWPVLLAAAVGLVAISGAAGRVGGFLAGAGVGFVAMALRAGFLADVASSRAFVVVLAVTVLTVLAALTKGAVPLWAGLAGYAAFAGLYGPIYADSPTTFLADAPLALVSLILATAIGTLAAVVANVGADAVTSSDGLAPQTAVEAGEVL